jgi:hypothetical protein
VRAAVLEDASGAPKASEAKKVKPRSPTRSTRPRARRKG